MDEVLFFEGSHTHTQTNCLTLADRLTERQHGYLKAYRHTKHGYLKADRTDRQTDRRKDVAVI